MVEIQHKEGMFYIEKEGRRVAEITYVPAGEGKINANHTYVSEEMRGVGTAAQLLDALVGYARENDLKIIPTCSYVVAKFARGSQYDDVSALK
ncbi:GNAT family N-acetyltransferase [Domibacillus antri]|uniref:GNAT family N-acetyltransferase n=1 Tax=Domibacillus antri TaxID=1714264 RepID=A0A1Q8Q533_9BACI|nr:GNAT family N-acetyltransferase [Domibacillus antri]OLN22466.1 GNAT family N-acetyltransferase [Domibacillus antri]